MRHATRRLGRQPFGLLLATLVCFVALYASGWAEEPPIKDYWLVTEKDGNAIGMTRGRVWPTESGFHYLVDATVQIDFAGSGPVRVTQQYDIFTDADRVVKSFDSVTQVNDSRTIQQGKLDDTGLHVSVTSPDGKTYTSTWKLDSPIYFEDGLLETLASEQKNAVVSPFTAQVYDFAQAAVVEKQYAFTSGTYKYKDTTLEGIYITDNRGMRYFYDLNGVNYWAESAQEKITGRFVQANDIPELKSLSVDTLSVPSNIVVNRPFASTASKIQVTWNDVPLTLFNWEDNRQHLVKFEEVGNQQHVWLETHRDERDFSGKISLPVTHNAFAPYLADVDYIQPSSAAIKQITASLVGNETDGWAVTRKLVEWVFNYIQPAMIPETLTAEQILDKKKGKCAEYAVLFASLARAAGLPTRIALGERFDSNMWIGHMWNEVWLGEWVAVDASHNQVAPDALLLKFVDSDSVMGTQKVRWGLVGKLGITIDDVTLPQNKVEAQTGRDGQTYTNADFGCQVVAPDGWVVTEAQEQGLPMVIMAPPDNENIQAILVMFSVPVGTLPEQVLVARIPTIQGMLPNFNLLGMGSQEVGTGATHAATAAWVFGQGTEQFRQENWIVVEGDVGYLFVFSAPVDGWPTAEAHFQAVRDSFQVLH